MRKFGFFIILISLNAFGYRPSNTKEIFLSDADKEKSMACNKRYINFIANHYFYTRVDYSKICSCDDVNKLDRRILHKQSFLMQAMLQKHSYLHVSCEKNYWLCLNVLNDQRLEAIKNADEYCKATDALIDESFNTPFSSPELKESLMNTVPIFNRPKHEWALASCEQTISKAKLHPSCSKGGGAGSGAGSVGSESQKDPSPEELH
jgi:hypothetical protein